MDSHDSLRSRKAFTLIELLVVIAIIAILAVVVVLTLNPAQLLAQARDANRVSDMATLNSAIGLYQTDMGGAGIMGSSSVVYTSLADSSSTCGNLGLPSLPASTVYDCSTATSTRLINNQGWIPIDFTKISAGAPFGSLPVDPMNSSSSGLYYSYVANGTQFMVTALPESQKQKMALGQGPLIPNYPDVIANGSSLVINPLFNASGLVGYWPMDEGTGSSTQDASGNNGTGTWFGNASSTNNTYYTAGRVGGYAGYFGGVNTYATGSLSINGLTMSVSFWLNASDVTTIRRIVDNSWNIKPQFGNNFTGTPGQLGLAFVTSNGQIGCNITGIATGIWYFITQVYTGSAVQCYENGSYVSQGTGGGTLVTSSLPVYLGGDYIAKYFGSLDDVRIYNRALSAAEIQALYNAEK